MALSGSACVIIRVCAGARAREGVGGEKWGWGVRLICWPCTLAIALTIRFKLPERGGVVFNPIPYELFDVLRHFLCG